jgi:hypothetical protein
MIVGEDPTRETGISVPLTMTNTLGLNGNVDSYEYPTSSGPMEGGSNKIQLPIVCLYVCKINNTFLSKYNP